MPRTAGLHPHAEGLKKVTGADVTFASPSGQAGTSQASDGAAKL